MASNDIVSSTQQPDGFAQLFDSCVAIWMLVCTSPQAITPIWLTRENALWATSINKQTITRLHDRSLSHTMSDSQKLLATWLCSHT